MAFGQRSCAKGHRIADAVHVILMLTCRMFRAAVVFSLQSWLGESEETRKNSSTPGYFSVGMARKFFLWYPSQLASLKLLTLVWQ